MVTLFCGKWRIRPQKKPPDFLTLMITFSLLTRVCGCVIFAVTRTGTGRGGVVQAPTFDYAEIAMFDRRLAAPTFQFILFIPVSVHSFWLKYSCKPVLFIRPS